MSDQKTYDDDDAIAFIRKMLPADRQDCYAADEIVYIIDIMFDWDEKYGDSLSEAVTDAELKKIPTVTDYVKRELKKDGEVEMDPDDIDLIVKAELEYEESIEDFD